MAVNSDKKNNKDASNALKPREKKILDYIREELRSTGYPPTVREICAAVGIRSTSTAHKDIASLVKKAI